MRFGMKINFGGGQIAMKNEFVQRSGGHKQGKTSNDYLEMTSECMRNDDHERYTQRDVKQTFGKSHRPIMRVVKHIANPIIQIRSEKNRKKACAH
jgi:hypothetical protein